MQIALLNYLRLKYYKSPGYYEQDERNKQISSMSTEIENLWRTLNYTEEDTKYFFANCPQVLSEEIVQFVSSNSPFYEQYNSYLQQLLEELRNKLSELIPSVRAEINSISAITT